MTDFSDIAKAVPAIKLRTRRRLITAAAVACTGFTAASVQAADYTWVGVSNALWDTASNWRVGGVTPPNAPTATDNIINPTSLTTVQLNASSSFSVNNWSMTATAGHSIQSHTTGPSSLAITGTLSKTNANSTLNFRNSTTQTLTISIATATVSGGTLSFGEINSNRIPNVTIGNLGISGSALVNFIAQGGSGTLIGTITGTVSMTGTNAANPATLSVAGAGNPNNTGTTISSEFRIGALDSSSDTTAIVQANANSTSPYASMVVLNGASGTTSFAGTIRDGATAGLNTVSIVKSGGSTQILSGNNTYRGGTTISGGTLLVNNALTVSGTGVGRVSVNSGGTLGGTGRIAPTVAGGVVLQVNSGGKIAPGSGGVGELTVHLGSTTGTVNFASGAEFAYELGAPNGTTTGPAAASDRLTFTGTAAGDVTFNNNVIDFGGTGTAVTPSIYKLFDSSLTTGTAWVGLTFSGQTITGGLSITNLNPAIEGATLFRGNGTLGDFDDIYLTVPEPGSATIVMGALGLGLLRRRQRPL